MQLPIDKATSYIYSFVLIILLVNGGESQFPPLIDSARLVKTNKTR